MDAYTLRDVTFILVHFHVSASFYVMTQARRVALLWTLILGTLLSLVVTGWTPTIYSALIVPFALGAVPGLVWGEILLAVFDRFKATLAPADAPPAADPERSLLARLSVLGCGQPTDTIRLAPLSMVVAVLVRVLLFILPLAVSDAALPWVIYVYLTVSIVVNTGFTVALRFSGTYARAWAVFWILSSVCDLVVLNAVAFLSLFWTGMLYACSVMLAMVAAFVAAPFTSADVQTATTRMFDDAFAKPDAPVYAPVPAPLLPHPQQPQQQYGLATELDQGERKPQNILDFFSIFKNSGHE